jgi:hypothetical protein
MTYRVELPELLKDCPNWWKFLRHKYDIAEDRDKFIADNYGTVYRICDGIIEYIEFPSEEHFSWFLLKL